MRTLPETPETFEMNGRLISIDGQGFLIDPCQWDEAIAEKISMDLNVELTPIHWILIRYVRSYFDERQITPDARHVFRYLESNTKCVNGKKEFFKLFPKGYVTQTCRIAGMRQPRAWSTG